MIFMAIRQRTYLVGYRYPVKNGAKHKDEEPEVDIPSYPIVNLLRPSHKVSSGAEVAVDCPYSVLTP